MKHRKSWILGIGCFAIVALFAALRWLVWRNRYVTNAELQAQATLEYERKNASFLAAHRSPLRKLSALDDKYQTAASAVAASLIDRKENPSEFRACVWEEDNGATIMFSLVHIDDFLPQHRGAIGNPSGKDREIVYDTKAAKITRIGLSQ